MLKPIKTKTARSAGGTLAIVASRYNARYVDAMLRAAKTELRRAGGKVQIVRVPGADEIPVVAAKLARQSTISHHLPRRHFARRDDARAAHRRGREQRARANSNPARSAGHP